MLKILAILTLMTGNLAFGLQASNIYFEFWPEKGYYRVRATYTVPELLEKREMHADFRNKKAAEELYWKLVKGADFFPGEPEKTKFIQPRMSPDPW